jgi:hypothetical protein
MDFKKIKPFAIALVVLVALSAAYSTVVQINGNKIGTRNQMGDYSGKGGGVVSPMAPGAVGIGAPEMMGFKSAAIEPATMTDQAFSSAAGGQDLTNTSIDQRIIKNGDLDLKVSSLDDSTEKINQIALGNGGELFSSNSYRNADNSRSGYLTVKVPVNGFEKTISEIKKIASLVVRESISGQDVTEEFTDLQAQLKNKQAEEQQFQTIMGQAQKIQDILDVTRELSRVRGEIESLQGRIKFMTQQTDKATISVSLTEDKNITVSDSWRPLQVAKDAVNTLIKKIQGFGNFVIILIVTVIPIAILYLLLIWLLFLAGKKIYLKIMEKRAKTE